MKKLILFSFFTYNFFLLNAQKDSIATRDTNKINVSGYVETYYNFDVDDPESQLVQPFFFNHAEKNQVALNLGMVRLGYDDDKVRGKIGLMAGDYPRYNLAAEPGILQNIFEASAGFRINKNMWVDAGIFPSHIGCESAIGKDNINLTRSLIAENSPYFETGVKVSYDRGKKWSFELLVLNGWQNIKETNRDKAIGTHVVFKANDRLSISSCGFAGNEKADTAKQYRLFHDLNLVWNKSDKFSLIAAFDIGAEQQPGFDSTSKWNTWHGGSLQLKISPWKKVSFGLRAEEYWDESSVITVPTDISGRPYGFTVQGGSFNIDVSPYKNVLWRTEFRYLNSQHTIFRNSNNKLSNTDMTAVTALIVTF
jgi:hypothetical protein